MNSFIFVIGLIIGFGMGFILTMTIKYVMPFEEEQQKKIPMEPDNIIFEDTGYDALDVGAMGNCPVCGELVCSYQKFCESCGQRLDWSDTE